MRTESIKHKKYHLSGLFNLEQIFSVLWFEMKRRSSEKMLLKKMEKGLLLDYILDIIISFYAVMWMCKLDLNVWFHNFESNVTIYDCGSVLKGLRREKGPNKTRN